LPSFVPDAKNNTCTLSSLLIQITEITLGETVQALKGTMKNNKEHSNTIKHPNKFRVVTTDFKHLNKNETELIIFIKSMNVCLERKSHVTLLR